MLRAQCRYACLCGLHRILSSVCKFGRDDFRRSPREAWKGACGIVVLKIIRVMVVVVSGSGWGQVLSSEQVLIVIFIEECWAGTIFKGLLERPGKLHVELLF